MRAVAAAAASPGISRADAEEFLFREAQALDDWRLNDWLALVTPDIDYRIPVRTNRETRDSDFMFSEATYYMVEDYGSLAARVQRLVSGVAFSESPRTRMRRHLSNVRIDSEPGAHPGAPHAGLEAQVRSNLLFFWSRDEMQRLVSAERRDTLRRVDGRLLLARRLVLLDHVSLPLPNLSTVL